PARAIEFPLVELHVLVPQRGRLHPSLPRLMRLILLDTVDVHNIGLGEHRIKTNLAGRPALRRAGTQWRSPEAKPEGLTGSCCGAFISSGRRRAGQCRTPAPRLPRAGRGSGARWYHGDRPEIP